MATKRNAMIDAVNNARTGNVVVVLDENGEYDCIPAAYLNDISYEGSRNVAFDLSNGLDDTGYDYLDEMTDEEIADFLIEND
ncbi:MAG: hypothetical protein H8D34_28850 [Chloroflexi bacterium]|nr:hypothetical protein [Chloroflexota bacterium]